MLLAQDKYLDAERFLKRALAVKEQVLKPGHRSISHTLNNLVIALEAQNKNAERKSTRRGRRCWTRKTRHRAAKNAKAAEKTQSNLRPRRSGCLALAEAVRPAGRRR
jgi:hypothetical protein